MTGEGPPSRYQTSRFCVSVVFTVVALVILGSAHTAKATLLGSLILRLQYFVLQPSLGYANLPIEITLNKS